MPCNTYCENGRPLSADTSYKDGLPRCLSETVSSLFLLVLIIFACLPQLLRLLHKIRRRKHRHMLIQEDVDQSIDATASDILLNAETPSSLSSKILDNPAGFFYGENYRSSFLYTCQLFFHVCQFILPLLDLVVKGKWT